MDPLDLRLCSCGHTRRVHEDEQPYECCYMDCGCLGFEYSPPTPPKPPIATNHLYEACKAAYEELNDRYDVEQFSDGTNKEHPFSGAGSLIQKLRLALEQAREEQESVTPTTSQSPDV